MAILGLKDKILRYKVVKLLIRWIGETKIGNNYFEKVYYEVHTVYVEPDGTVTDRKFIPERGNEYLPIMAKIWEKDPVTYEAEINGILAGFGLEVDASIPIQFEGGEDLQPTLEPSLAPEVTE